MPPLLTMTGRPEAIHDAIQRLTVTDDAVAARECRLRTTAWAWLILAGLTGFAAIVMGHEYFDYLPGLYIRLTVAGVFLVCLVIGLIFLRMRIVTHRDDLDDVKLRVTRELFSRLHHVTSDTDPAMVDIQFGSYLLCGQVVEELPADELRNVFRHAIIHDRWLSLRGRFADGRAFTLTVTREVEYIKANYFHFYVMDGVVESLGGMRSDIARLATREIIREAVQLECGDTPVIPDDNQGNIQGWLTDVRQRVSDGRCTLTATTETHTFTDPPLDFDDIEESLEEMDFGKQLISPPVTETDETTQYPCFVSADALMQLLTAARDVAVPSRQG